LGLGSLACPRARGPSHWVTAVGLAYALIAALARWIWIAGFAAAE